MDDQSHLSPSRSDRVLGEGDVYDHAEYGRVRVTGIWYRTRRLESVHTTEPHATIVVRFVPAEGGDWTDERAASLEDFLAATD